MRVCRRHLVTSVLITQFSLFICLESKYGILTLLEVEGGKIARRVKKWNVASFCFLSNFFF